MQSCRNRLHFHAITIGVLIVWNTFSALGPFLRASPPPEIEWEMTFALGDFCVAQSIQQTSDGGYVAAGWCDECFLVKLDPLGNLDPGWPINPETLGGEIGSIQETREGGYIVVGSSAPQGSYSDVHLIRLDDQGGILWERTFGEAEDNDIGGSVQETSDGGYIVSGITRSTVTDSQHVFLLKLDTKGNLDPAWTINPKTFPAMGAPPSVRETNDGGYLLIGTTVCYLMKLDSQGNYDPTWPANPKIFPDACRGSSVQQTADGGFLVGSDHLFKTDSQGKVLWEISLGNGGRHPPPFALETADGGALLASTYVYTSDWCDYAAYLARTDNRGRLIWENIFGGRSCSSSAAYSVQTTTDGGYVFAGRKGGQAYLVKLSKEAAPNVIPGDCNQDARLDLSDAVCLLGFLFLGDPKQLPCGNGSSKDPGNISLMDWQPDGASDISDAVAMLTFLFLGGPPHALAVPGAETKSCVPIVGCPNFCAQ